MFGLVMRKAEGTGNVIGHILAAIYRRTVNTAASEQRREKTRARKQAILQELLTGRTRLL
jgi:hypothetical protein